MHRRSWRAPTWARSRSHRGSEKSEQTHLKLLYRNRLNHFYPRRSTSVSVGRGLLATLRSKSALASAAMLATFISVAHADGVPIQNGWNLSHARAVLMRDGWEPVRTFLRYRDGSLQKQFGDSRIILQAGYPEMEYCSGTGLNYCFLNYRKHHVCVRMETQGEYHPEFHREPIVVGWTHECTPLH
jgi:hypothetical protein